MNLDNQQDDPKVRRFEHVWSMQLINGKTDRSVSIINTIVSRDGTTYSKSHIYTVYMAKVCGLKRILLLVLKTVDTIQYPLRH